MDKTPFFQWCVRNMFWYNISTMILQLDNFNENICVAVDAKKAAPAAVVEEFRLDNVPVVSDPFEEALEVI